MRNQRLKWKKTLNCQVREALITVVFSKGNIQTSLMINFCVRPLQVSVSRVFIVVAVGFIVTLFWCFISQRL